MSLFKKTYVVTNRYGCMYFLTAKQIYERTIDIQNNFDLFVPAKELVGVCKKSSFPTEYSIAIKIAILKFFANKDEAIRYPVTTQDKEAIQYCYNSLYGIDMEEVVSARKEYLSKIISTATHFRTFEFIFSPGPTIKKLHEDFINSKLNEYISQEKINFKNLIRTLINNFSEIVAIAGANEDFDVDEEYDVEKWKMFYQNVLSKYEKF